MSELEKKIAVLEKAAAVYEKAVKSSPDGNVHTMPLGGMKHFETEHCWCEPQMIGDFTDHGGTKCYLHKEFM